MVKALRRTSYAEQAENFVFRSLRKASKRGKIPIPCKVIRKVAKEYKRIPKSPKGKTPLSDWFVTDRYLHRLVDKGRAKVVESPIYGEKLEHFLPVGR